MSSWRLHLLILLTLALAAVPSASVAAEDAGTEPPGFVSVQIDGLSEPVLRTALESGAMPFFSSLIDHGTHTLEGWRTTAASTTTVMQAGVLHGRRRDIPGFRWWDRETGQLLDFLDREQARLFEERSDGPADLLAEGGASITDLFAGGAPRVILTAAHFDGAALPWEVQDPGPSPEASSTTSPAPPSPPPAAHIGAPVCVSAQVSGALGKACARRDRFGARWTLEATDTQADDRPVKATIKLEVTDARDETATLEHDLGVGDTVSTDGSFSPRIGSALGDISVTTCVVVRFRPDRCETTSATLPQIASRATPAQSARLERLVFVEPIERFMSIWEHEEHPGIDADFDWNSNGCSAGPLVGLFDERLGPACIRHDFAYRNYGHLLYAPTDSIHRRVDEQLAADAIALGYANLAPGLRQTLQRFGAPAFFGRDMATAWSVPTFLVPFLSTDETGASPD